MPRVIVDTDFIIHKEDEQWSDDEIQMIEQFQPNAYQGNISNETFHQMAERLAQGDQRAWELLDDQHSIQ
ncbi:MULTISPECIES: hypothetical protein [Glaesserella]|uniref:Uncharacterized protein n=1 Tax=Glaesserella australis TaxID=2094024 RepID=A0A328BZV4_9PAST|nr:MULTISPECIES: hypothetical protein [Glaesserella]AUI65467.1 hypothetical protein CJD39_02235 [Glaesserella sp. 15-184]RAL19663.1 hypothetical protein C5N92_01320 [Glaesserella australis]